MGFPAFFDAVPPLTLRDPLAEFLGAAAGGLIEYRYADAVKFAGHSCPTVAGAYLMTWRSLRALYGDEMPERGGVRIELRESQGHGVAGVIAGVITLLHQGMVIVGVPYSEKRQMTLDEITGGSPYGASTITGGDGSRQPSENELAIARFQGRHVAGIAARLKAGG